MTSFQLFHVYFLLALGCFLLAIIFMPRETSTFTPMTSSTAPVTVSNQNPPAEMRVRTVTTKSQSVTPRLTPTTKATAAPSWTLEKCKQTFDRGNTFDANTITSACMRLYIQNLKKGYADLYSNPKVSEEEKAQIRNAQPRGEQAYWLILKQAEAREAAQRKP